MNLNSKRIKKNSGAAMLIFIIFFVFISLAIVFGLILPSVRGFQNTSLDLNSKKSYFLAESGSEDATYRIFNSMPISGIETITLDSNSVTTTITTTFVNTKKITSLAGVSSSERKTSLNVRTGEGVVFKYGTQAGQGGFVFHPNSHITGSLYSNGDIVGSNGAYITGAAFAAGPTGSINNMRIGFLGLGDAYSHTITNSTITGNVYCKVGSGNNKPCDVTTNDPLPKSLPIPDESIAKWKDDAENPAKGGSTNNGNMTINVPTSLGPKKIVGDLTVNSTLNLTGTIYVTGNIFLNIGGKVKLDVSYGATSGILMSDGYIRIKNNVIFEDSGTPGSYIMLLSESNCDASMGGAPCNGNNALDVSNNSNISIVVAQKGTVYFSNNATVKETVGNKIELKNNVGISYGSGIIDVGFTSGPSGSWHISDWGETQ